MFPLTLEGKFELPTIADQDKAASRALDDIDAEFARLRLVPAARTCCSVRFRLGWLAQFWHRAAPVPGIYSVSIASERESLFVSYAIRSPGMMAMSAALSVVPALTMQVNRGPLEVLILAWVPLVWAVHTANMLLARRWFRRLLQGVVSDPARMRYHGV